MDRQQTVTGLLYRVRSGDRDAFDRLFPMVYDEMRVLARRQRWGWVGDQTLGTTALVHEAYLRLVDQSSADWRSRGHFGAVASRAMRHILIDYARRRRAAKRGGPQANLSLDGVTEPAGTWTPEQAESLIALHEALAALERENERLARIVEMKFFGGLTVDEIGAALDLSPATVKRGWTMAQTWLYRAMGGGTGVG